MTEEKRPALRPFHNAAAAFAGGTDTPREFLERCIAVIEADQPKFHAFVNLDLADARAAADASTKRWKEGAPLSSIDGLPVGIKDIIETANMPTEMGSPLFAGYRSGRDAASVAALREAGAVVVGKTVTTEFAATVPRETRNPWDPARTPGGSSSGSACAVGDGMVPAALGTQVIGSILRPAAYCGAFGYKPSVGGINRGGSVDYHSQSCQGVIAASLEDAWLTAREITARAGGDPGFPGIRGPRTVPEPRKPARLALLQTAGWAAATDDAKAQLQAVLDRFRAAGIAIADRTSDSDIAKAEDAVADAFPLSTTINTWDFRWPLNVFARNMDHSKLSSVMQERLVAAERMTLEEYQDAIAERDRSRAIFAALADRFDAAVTLTAPDAAPLGLEWTGNPIFVVPGSMLGVPAVTLPLMRTQGLPLGLQLLGFNGRDADLFSVARAVAALP
jgi:Asp-tRNA(Asn)/Glu-tRNA(Gln) amidotransferase A subunit family amidase